MIVESINVTGHLVLQTHCNDSDIYTNNTLQSSIEHVFNLPEIKNRIRGTEWDSHYGNGETSEIIPLLGPANLPGGSQLTQWILDCAREVYGPVEITRSWMNRLQEGSQGRCHNHSSELLGTPDVVAIFYVANPENGSQLVITDSKYAGQLPSDIPESDKQYITSITGDLIMHGPEVWHAVSEHRNTIARICFVYQLTLTNK